MFKSLYRFLFLAISCAALSCSGDPCALTENDLSGIRAVNAQYVEGWLNNDTSGILGLFTEDAVVYPSGLPPLRGLDEIAAFWFPDDGSSTTIHGYNVEIERITGCRNHAQTAEHGVLSFNYTKGDFHMLSESRSHAITLYERIDDTWKITRRIWTDLHRDQ